MQLSPYTPGEVTTYLPGREVLMRRARATAQEVADGGAFIARPTVYVGGRGVGKTSLLRYAERAAQEQGLATVWITAGDAELMPVLMSALLELTSSWRAEARERITQLVKSLEVTLALGAVSIKKGAASADGKRAAQAAQAPGQALEALIGNTARSVREQGGRGLAIFVDELQAADQQALRALAYAWQHLQSWGERPPALLMAAGLGHTSDVVTDAATFAERFQFLRLKDLGREAAYAALVDPAERLGVTWQFDAVEALLEKAAGYPHFLQICAQAAWEAAGSPDSGARITMGAVAASEDEVADQLEVFYRTRWGKATPAERELLRAVAQQKSDTARRSDVATTMGKSTQAISMARRSLMDKGILDSPARGLLSFTAPGFSEYILEYDGIEG